jgi:hypothetical protein
MNNIRHRALRNALLGAAMVLVPSTLWAGGLAVPHTFAPATAIKAQDMNDNFAALFTAVNKQTALKHVADATNSANYWTCIDDASANGDPNAMLIVTHNYVYNGNDSFIPSQYGVFYSGTSVQPNNRWCIYRDDKNPILANSAFNVLVIKQ